MDGRIASLESEIAEASRKITVLSEISSAYGTDSSSEIEEMKGALQTKKEEAESRILELEGKIRATDIGSFKFVARAFDSEVQAAEATENPVLIKEALDRAVNRVVKWFILILVVVFDPLAVTLVIAYNASLLRIKNGDSKEEIIEEENAENTGVKEGKKSSSGLPVIIVVAGLIIFGIYLSEKNSDPAISQKTQKASLIGQLAASKVDDRAFAYIPEKSFGVISFSVCMVDEVGLTKVFTDDLLIRFLLLAVLLGIRKRVEFNHIALYFLQFPGFEDREERSGDISTCSL